MTKTHTELLNQLSSTATAQAVKLLLYQAAKSVDLSQMENFFTAEPETLSKEIKTAMLKCDYKAFTHILSYTFSKHTHN